MVSYPPTIDELRAAFLEQHPGYVFAPEPGYPTYTAPQEDVERSGPSPRRQEWINYLNHERVSLALEANIDSQPIDFPMWHGNRLEHAIRNYEAICRHPAVTPAARLYREREDRYRGIETGRLLTLVQNGSLPYGYSPKDIPDIVERAVTNLRYNYRSHSQPVNSMAEFYHHLQNAMAWALERQKEDEVARTTRPPAFPDAHQVNPRKEKIATLASAERLSVKESEAVLGYILPSSGYNENTLLALQVLNRYAANVGCSVKEAVEYMALYTIA